MAATVELRDTQFLCSMDGQQAFKDLGVAKAGILFFDELNHRPHCRFPMVSG
ncbi:MAG: hypothetical protein ABSC88_08920 [Terracidiphilus sp.]